MVKRLHQGLTPLSPVLACHVYGSVYMEAPRPCPGTAPSVHPLPPGLAGAAGPAMASCVGSAVMQRLTSYPPTPCVPAVGRSGERLMLSGTGLLLPRQLPFERWLSIGQQLSAVCTSAAW